MNLLVQELDQKDHSQNWFLRVQEEEGFFDVLFYGIEEILVMLRVPHPDRDPRQQFSSSVDPYQENLSDVLLHLLVIEYRHVLLVF
jgi:hypothetical protein